MEYIVNFGDGTVYRTSWADSKQEAKEQAYVVLANAMQYGQRKGQFKNKQDFMKRVTVTKE
jgi:hypothetical protein